MARYLTLVFGALLVLETGCHKSTGPTEVVTNDSTTSFPDLNWKHYPVVVITFSNILMAGLDKNTDPRNNINFNDTTVRSSSSNIQGVFHWSNPSVAQYDHLAHKGKITPGADSILDLADTYGVDWYPEGQFITSSSIHWAFKNLSFNYGSDSSIDIVLTGLEAGFHIDGLSDYYHADHQPNKLDDYNYAIDYNHKYYSCTDSTRLEIFLQYVK